MTIMPRHDVQQLGLKAIKMWSQGVHGERGVGEEAGAGKGGEQGKRDGDVGERGEMTERERRSSWDIHKGWEGEQEVRAESKGKSGWGSQYR